MGIAKQLYQLQEVDLELESHEQALARITGQLGESQTVATARSEFTRGQQLLEELRRQQVSAEWEIDDFTTKLAAVEETLYSGRIKSPKELSNLQREAGGLRDRRSQVEDRALEVMERVSEMEARVATLESELERLEEEWHRQQQQLLAEMERHKEVITDLKQGREQLVSSVDSSLVSVYEDVKKRKGRAVAKVEGGTCRGCGISLSTAQLQQAKGDRLVQCPNCGRILFFA